jgi:uncharacterized membrane protein YeaQ/YmgE (transglycosylase-associated protein family)
MPWIPIVVVGLFSGFLGMFLTPGRGPLGSLVTFTLGAVGALLASFIAANMHFYEGGWASFVGAVTGSAVLIALYNIILRRPGTRPEHR